MESLLQDLRHAARRLALTPGFTLVAALALGLGIGGSTTALAALEALLLRPLPYEDPERLVLVHQADGRQPHRAVAPANFLDWRARSRSFSGLAAFQVVGRTLVQQDAAHRLDAAVVSGSFFEVLGRPPALGRTFGGAPDGPRELVLGDAAWRDLFAADPAVIGRVLRLDQELVSVVAVMPPGFGFPRDAQVWLRARHDVPELQIAANVDARSVRDARYLGVVGRLARETSLAAAQAEMDGVAARLVAEYPDANAGQGVRIEPLWQALRGSGRPALALVGGAALLVLLVACANVANLLLARASGRERDLAVRAALGASGARIARELAAEALLLAGLGLAVGILLAGLALPSLRALWPARLPPLEGAALTLPVLAGSAALALASALVVSLVPARLAARPSALAALRASGRGPRADRTARRFRSAVVMVEVALAVVLVSGASLLLGTVSRLQQAPLGFVAGGALTARLELPRPLGQERAALRAFAGELEARVRALPGVSAAALGQALPLTGLRASAGLRVEGRDAEPNAQPDACWRLVSASWHAALGTRVLRGRGFDARDTSDAPPVAVVNATLARQVFGDSDAVGRRVATGLDGPPGTWVTIVGVVADTPQESVARATRPELHRPLAQDVRMGPTSLTLVARASGDALALADAVRREVRAVRADVAVSRVEPLASVAEEMVAPARAASRVTVLFGALGLLLAALGLYGVVSCVVGEETPELGVRLALGASPAALVSLVLRRSLSLAAAGLVLGLAAALAAARALRGLLYGIAPHDPASFAVVCGVLLAAATVAALGPARRAARLDPARVLRGE